MTTLIALEAARAALATAATTITFTVSERDDAQHGAVIVVENTALEGLDDAEAFEVQERDDRASAKALEAAGFEMVSSGANGAPHGGCWSYWRAPEAYAGASITVEVGRHTIDPQGLGTDEECERCEAHILDAVREAFPGADVRAVGVGGRTSGVTASDEDITDEVRHVVNDAFNAFMGG